MLLHDVFEFHAVSRGDLVFAVDGVRSVSYGEAYAHTCQITAAIAGSGLAPGDRLAYVGANSLEHVLAYYAASRAGVVLVPLNARSAPDEVAFALDDSGARAIVADAALSETLGPALDSHALLARVSVGGEGPRGWIGWDHWLAAAPGQAPDVRSSADDVVYQMYSSGTTGRPKGVLLTHRSVLANCAQVTAGVGRGVDAGDRWLIVAPLFHAAAVITAFNAVIGGGCLVLHRGFDPERVVEALHAERIALTTLVPAMIQACLAVAHVDERDYPDLAAIAYGGSAIAEHTLRRAMAVFGCDFYQGFGQTESSAGLTYLNEVDHRCALDGRPELLASCGRALPGTEIRIVDGDGRIVPAGVVGEIVARGPQLMNGYWNRPDDTARALRGGWLHTGDAGSLDDDGYLYVRDRLTDMIVSGGENIYPREVENVLIEHPDVVDVAVVGVPDERWGEAVHAVVVPAPDHEPTLAELADHCAARLASFKAPRSVEFVDTIPRNAAGKVRKADLKAPHWMGRSRGVA